MTHDRYLQTLTKLGLTPHGQATMDALDRKPRQLMRYADGSHPIPGIVAKLLTYMLREKDRGQ